MLSSQGLVTYVVTYHQHVLLMALLVAAVSTVPFVLFLARERTALERFYLGVSLFVGVAFIAHLALSSVFGHDALDVETIRLQAVKDDGASTAPSIAPPPATKEKARPAQ